MKSLARILSSAALAVGLAAASLASAPARADMSTVYTAGKMKVSMPWTRATPKGVDVAVGYVTITNTGTEPDRLTGGSTSVAAHFELHEMSTSGGVMKMRELEGIDIKPGQTVELKPNGFHIMMTDLKQQIKKGDHIKATLTFEKAGSVDVDFEAGGVGGGMPGMSGM
ncbi:copper chaperone PCu(A)C [Methylovirgula sp. 4M-Z18]|uniref:copper chaperone PCu(A)C n=1 Tax=Methylovirgula sp. 4M-Z18 TaxID=2293567 RepID=UPI000E2EB056|nr:copper chaperone PCu(A)C [Methylovirgula sp. 4M-Z18]RFB80686.1 copper chaperone PCu(A)C [Methylovirgula sp. 4M-Z18]